MPTILVTNDDGIRSPGLAVLAKGLQQLPGVDVRVLAPERNWSAASQLKTLHKPLRINPATLTDGSPGQSSSGSPTDCVALGIAGAVGVQPDLVVSGINDGYNVGIDVAYSGTVACAREATIKGVPGIAVSTVASREHSEAEVQYAQLMAAEAACQVAQAVLNHGLPSQTLLNINVPYVTRDLYRGMQITRMGGRNYEVKGLIERHDPKGMPYYWIGGTGPIDAAIEGTDVHAVNSGYVSVSPITLDMTDYTFLSQLENWQLDDL